MENEWFAELETLSSPSGSNALTEKGEVALDMIAKMPVDHYRLFVFDSIFNNIVEVTLWRAVHAITPAQSGQSPKSKSPRAMVHQEQAAATDCAHNNNGHSRPAICESLP